MGRDGLRRWGEPAYLRARLGWGGVVGAGAGTRCLRPWARVERLPKWERRFVGRGDERRGWEERTLTREERRVWVAWVFPGLAPPG